jgi:hypothetical protein
MRGVMVQREQPSKSSDSRKVNTEMKYKILILLMLVPSIGSTADFVLTDPAQIEDANAIQKSIDAISARVSQCVEKKLAEPPRCFGVRAVVWRA